MAHYNQKWTDEKISLTLREVRLKYDRVTRALLIKEAPPGIYDALWRRVRRGDFRSVAEAIETIEKISKTILSVPSPDIAPVQQKEGRPLKWTAEEIMKTLVVTFLEKGKITFNSNGGIYATISRRVRKGEFGSTKEAMERLWFQGLFFFDPVAIGVDTGDKNFLLKRAAEWLVDTTNNGNAKSVKRLNRLIGLEEERMRIILKEVFRPCYPAAQSIIGGFVVSRRGKKLRGLMSAMGISVMN